MTSRMERDSNQFSICTRHKCTACFKQYKKKEHLIEHMKVSCHSAHEPKCGVCQKHCKSYESLREHLTGPLAKANCSTIFADRGCKLCLKLFDTPSSLSEHREVCCLNGPAPLGTMKMPHTNSQRDVDISTSMNGFCSTIAPEAIALDCEMVGGGSDGSLDLCARIGLVDEDEKLVFHAYVLPQIPVTDYRSEVTGITEEHLKDAMPLTEVQEKVLRILYNGESIGKARLDGGKARLLVGHSLENDLDCLRMSYPDHLLRDTAKYRPLLKTNFSSHSLKYLTREYLGYDIQLGVHDPYEDCVSVMRLYKRMRSQDHQLEGIESSSANQHSQGFGNVFETWKPNEMKQMMPNELVEVSKSNYRCWCLDSLLKS